MAMFWHSHAFVLQKKIKSGIIRERKFLDIKILHVICNSTWSISYDNSSTNPSIYNLIFQGGSAYAAKESINLYGGNGGHSI